MNDPTDMAWVTPYVQMLLNRHVDPDKLTTPEAALVREFSRTLEINTPEVYVASFSQLGDVLSQWRAYADDGAGFALGFDPKSFGLHHVLVPQLQLGGVSDRTVGMVKVFYGEIKPEEAISPYIDAFVEGKMALEDAVINIRAIALSVKNPAYEEEREWRIIYSPIVVETAEHTLQIIGKAQEMLFRPTKYGVFPYFKLPYTTPALKEVILGPKNRTPLEVVKLWLIKHGHGEAVIKKSKSTYR